MSPILCGKRSFLEDLTSPTLPVAKRIRCSSWLPAHYSLPEAPSTRSSMREVRRLDECGVGVDSAIRNFKELFLESVGASDACNINGAFEPNSQLQTQVETRVSGECVPSEAQWDELIVSEVMSAFNRGDARARVLKALEARDQEKFIAASAEAAQNLQQENAMLKEENAVLKEKNIIPNRVAAKQHKKHNDFEDKMTQQLHHLKQELQVSKMENDDLKKENNNLKMEIARLKLDQQNSFVYYRPIRHVF